MNYSNSPNDKRELAAFIDHTLLKPDAVPADIRRACDEALEYEFAAVCVNPCWVRMVAERLAGSDVRACAVVGFPLGANLTQVKMLEAAKAAEHGAEEIDMVLNVGALRAGDYHLVHKDIADVAEAAHGGGALLKVILENCLLTGEQKVLACRLAMDARADFVKTSTGFSSAGATAADVRLMRATVGNRLGVKASGGIRTLAVLREMLAAGATRIGASAGVEILHEMDGKGAEPPAGKY